MNEVILYVGGSYQGVYVRDYSRFMLVNYNP